MREREREKERERKRERDLKIPGLNGKREVSRLEQKNNMESVPSLKFEEEPVRYLMLLALLAKHTPTLTLSLYYTSTYWTSSAFFAYDTLFRTS